MISILSSTLPVLTRLPELSGEPKFQIQVPRSPLGRMEARASSSGSMTRPTLPPGIMFLDPAKESEILLAGQPEPDDRGRPGPQGTAYRHR